MKKKNLSKLFIFLMTAFLGVNASNGEVSMEQPIQTESLPAVSIEKLSGTEICTMENVKDGIHSGLKAVYGLSTNGTDSDYDFVITAKTTINGAEVPAYTTRGELIFARINSVGSDVSAYPTTADYTNVELGNSNNRNIIAYPVRVTTTSASPITSYFDAGYKTYGSCYIIQINNNSEATIMYNVDGNPVRGSYSLGQDEAGTYKATITFSAIPKSN